MINVMIVDDNKIIGEGMRDLIDWNSLGFYVTAVERSPKKAIRDAGILNVDVVLTDIIMPEMSGLELIEGMRELYPEIQYIIISAFDNFKYAQKAIRYGVKSYLLKPVKEEDLISVLLEIRKNKKSGNPSDHAEHITSGDKDVVSKVINHIEHNYSEENLKLQILADMYYVNVTYLGQIFKQKTGKSFNNYLLDLRIKKAKQLLTDSDMKIYEISKSVGFADPNYFSIKFSQEVGITPKEYKKRGQNNGDRIYKK